MPTLPLTRPCVLIIDDDKDALHLTRTLVSNADPTVNVVTSCGAAAGIAYLSHASSGKDEAPVLPSLLLLDLNMPDIDGFEVLQWIRRNGALAEIKVVVLSSSDSQADIRRASELGANGYLIKNPHPTVLRCLLSQICGTHDNSGSERRQSESRV